MMVIPDNPENPKAEIARIVAERARYSDEYYHIVGVNDCDFLHDDIEKDHRGRRGSLQGVRVIRLQNVGNMLQ